MRRDPGADFIPVFNKTQEKCSCAEIATVFPHYVRSVGQANARVKPLELVCDNCSGQDFNCESLLSAAVVSKPAEVILHLLLKGHRYLPVIPCTPWSRSEFVITAPCTLQVRGAHH